MTFKPPAKYLLRKEFLPVVFNFNFGLSNSALLLFLFLFLFLYEIAELLETIICGNLPNFKYSSTEFISSSVNSLGTKIVEPSANFVEELIPLILVNSDSGKPKRNAKSGKVSPSLMIYVPH